MNIYVGNLNHRVREEDLKAAMEPYGTVASAKIVIGHKTGRSKSYGFIEVEEGEGARKAIEELNGKELEGRQMVVREALPKK